MNKEEIKNICEKYHIDNYTINDDLSIDVNDNVGLYDIALTEFPLKFRNVSGNFYCHHNKLTTLKGAPEFIGGDFICSHNYLESLEYGPKIVNGDYDCGYNSLKTLVGSPSEILNSFHCSGNDLTSLEGAPISVVGYFQFSGNDSLNNLIGFPTLIGKTTVSKSVKSLEGIPLDLKKENFKIWNERNKSFIKFEDYNNYCRNIKFGKILNKI